MGGWVVESSGNRNVGGEEKGERGEDGGVRGGLGGGEGGGGRGQWGCVGWAWGIGEEGVQQHMTVEEWRRWAWSVPDSKQSGAGTGKKGSVASQSMHMCLDREVREGRGGEGW